MLEGLSEILQPGWAQVRHDRGTKFTAYRGIETLSDYLLIDRDVVHIESFAKEDDGTWRLREYFAMEDVVSVQSIQVVVPVREMHERVAPVPGERLQSCPR